MNFQASCEAIKKCSVQLYPFPHAVIDNFLSPENLTLLKASLEFLISNVEPRVFASEHGSKFEYKLDNTNQDPEYLPFAKMMAFLTSKECADSIKETFSLDFDLEGDSSFDGGGFVISPPGSFLGYHADFNYSSNVKKFRVANILLYMNGDYKNDFGGNLQLLHQDSLTVEKSVEPTENRAVIFLTTDKTPHGVSRNLQEFSRKSFNAYFYTEKNPSNTSNNPHKTIWLNDNV
jgi:Rps23 Pro-64 3,4-dihydroxylase Tpa1-like proline 4-hydroxylase